MDDQISALENYYKIPTGLLGAIINRGEASGETATSPKGAYGRAQLMPATARDMGVDPSDPNQNLEGGARYVATLVNKYGADRPDLVAAAYNAGPGAVDRHGGVPPYPETQAYVARVTNAVQNQQPSDDDLAATFAAQGGGAPTPQAAQAPQAPTASAPALPAPAMPAAQNAEPTDDDLAATFAAQKGGAPTPQEASAPQGGAPQSSTAPDTYNGGTKVVAGDGSISYRKPDGTLVAFGNPNAGASTNASGVVDLDLGANTNPESLAAYDKAHPYTPPTNQEKEPDITKDPAAWAAYHFGPSEVADRVGVTLRGVINKVTGGFADKGEAAVAAIPDFIKSGAGAFGKAYSSNLDQQQQIDATNAARYPQLTQNANTTGDIAQSALIPEMKVASPLITAAKGALVGGGIAALNTLGNARGNFGQEASQAIRPTIEGAALGGILAPIVSPRLPGKAAATAPIASMQDYAQAGVDPMLGVNGGRTAQQVTQVLHGLPFVGTPIAQAVKRTAGQVGSGVAAQAQALGSSVEPEQAGSALQQGAQDAVAAMKAKSGALYAPINALEANPTPIPVANTQAATQSMFDKFPNSEGLFRKQAPKIAELHDALGAAGGHLTFAELKAHRSNVGEMMRDHSIISNVDTARLKHLYGAMSDDMVSAAGSLGGPQAESALRAANAHNAHMHRTIDETLHRVIGEDSTRAMIPREQAYSRVVQAARVGGKGDIEQLEQLRDALPKHAWQEVGAGIVNQLGKGTDGHFSVAKFATDWGKLSKEGKNTILPPETVNALDRLSRIAQNQGAFSKLYNHSGSGSHTITALAVMEPLEEFGRHAIAGNIHGAIKALALPAGVALAGRGAAELLAHPGFAKVMLNASKTSNPTMIDAMFAKYAANNPAVKTSVDRYRALVARRLLTNTLPVVAANSAATQVRQGLLGQHTGQ